MSFGAVGCEPESRRGKPVVRELLAAGPSEEGFDTALTEFASRHGLDR